MKLSGYPWDTANNLEFMQIGRFCTFLKRGGQYEDQRLEEGMTMGENYSNRIILYLFTF